MIVEDEPLIRLLVTETFADAGFDVQEAEDGDSAIALIQNPSIAFTLLVTDIHMPGQHDGMAVATVMQQSFPEVPVIYTTGRPDVLDRIGPLRQGDAFVAKPFVTSQLLNEAHRLLAKSDGRHEP